MKIFKNIIFYRLFYFHTILVCSISIKKSVIDLCLCTFEIIIGGLCPQNYFQILFVQSIRRFNCLLCEFSGARLLTYLRFLITHLNLWNFGIFLVRFCTKRFVFYFKCSYDSEVFWLFDVVSNFQMILNVAKLNPSNTKWGKNLVKQCHKYMSFSACLLIGHLYI